MNRQVNFFDGEPGNILTMIVSILTGEATNNSIEKLIRMYSYTISSIVYQVVNGTRAGKV